MEGCFEDYCAYYDLLYQDKDYEGEAKYIDFIINRFLNTQKIKDISILELGCGTGKHASLLNAMGYRVHGIDSSDTMIEIAKKRERQGLSFVSGDVRNYRNGKMYDIVISLFHIASYQRTNEDLRQYFETASSHLKTGGVFIFDFWYGPAVLTQKPETRVKDVENEDYRVIRTVKSTLLQNEDAVDVHYTMYVFDKKYSSFNTIKETHHMRYLFLPEVRQFLADAGFSTGSDKTSFEEWLSGREPSCDTWGVIGWGRKK